MTSRLVAAMTSRLVAAMTSRLVAALPDVAGVVAFALVVSGVWELAGPAWARIALGAPLLIAYGVREVASRRKGRT